MWSPVKITRLYYEDGINGAERNQEITASSYMNQTWNLEYLTNFAINKLENLIIKYI